MGELITQSEFARRIKKTPQYVNKLVKQGKIILKGKFKKVDYEEGIIFLAANKRPANELGEKFNKEQIGKGGKKAAQDRAAGKIGKSAAAEIDPEVNNTSKAMQKARLIAEINSAKIKEIEYKKAIGELVPIKIVNSELAKVAEVIRTKLISLEDKLPPILIIAENQNDIKNIVRKEINSILEEFQELSKTAVSNYEE